MNSEEYKKLARNKIEADALTQQVRDVIKTTKWQKQDMREGFKETFKPLIKSQDSIKKSIDEQQNATIAQLKANQLALTSGLEKINETNLRLAEMRELPALEGVYDDPSTSRPRSPTCYNIEKNFDKVDLELLEIMGYPRPNNFFGTDIDRLEEILNEVKNDLLNKMEERAIHISSINREKRGTSKPGDFTIKFNPSLKLNPEKKHQLALDRLSMTYSWYNIRSDYGNNKIKYTHDGTN
ncbi:unnamed protein product [Porites lobata]|uniref:Uncharacterized protein n=1 Tax=Porites lobata TaxID=104759 RepID=A0ABN8QKY4_9CNID|nr:unnamed protein product [Porites lobata]